MQPELQAVPTFDQKMGRRVGLAVREKVQRQLHTCIVKSSNILKNQVREAFAAAGDMVLPRRLCAEFGVAVAHGQMAAIQDNTKAASFASAVGGCSISDEKREKALEATYYTDDRAPLGELLVQTPAAGDQTRRERG
ncbi:hypothetical protein MAPG_02591 [Magnaporthiopsis poae ATCC 64411]|uniref:Uncharacterized protein n=1 Tax=Magnaporthiopsis poae (strain ATCC 64411 / 73-15) TaxID=644358 RepID=A0A0C4DRS7_MAGP6|nr:hypothetical protein MAPG_02591 [Magnaporthiopsis poae ATCC 64411]